MKNVLLITPPYHCGVVESAGRWMPLGLVYIAGHLRRAGHRVTIYDAMSKFHSFGHIRDKIKSLKPDIVGVTAITATVNDALVVLRIAKEVRREIVTVMGGVHPTFCYEEMLEDSGQTVDFVVLGEGEVTTCELVNALDRGEDVSRVEGIAYKDENGTIIKTYNRGFIPNLDEVTPAWDLLNWEDYTYFIFPGSRLAVVNSSRGCSHDCSFCSQQKFWKQSWRGRSPEKFVKDLEDLNRAYGAGVFLISDEYPTYDKDRWEEILDRLIFKGLGVYILMETRVEDIIRDKDILWKYRKAGVVHIYIGVEATSQALLDKFKKDIKVEQSLEAIRLINDAEMISETSFVLGTPEETRESIRNTLELAKYYDPDFAHFLMLAPWPYADIYGELRDHIEEFDYSKYNLIDPIIKPLVMSREELRAEMIYCYRDFYMGKLSKLMKLQDGFKRKYLLSSFMHMMNSSFLRKYIGSLGKIPKTVSRMLGEESDLTKKALYQKILA